jgi:hypothetical protein
MKCILYVLAGEKRLIASDAALSAGVRDFPGGPEWCMAEETETTGMNADGEEVVKLQRETLVDEIAYRHRRDGRRLTQIQPPCQRHTRRLQSEPLHVHLFGVHRALFQEPIQIRASQAPIELVTCERR